MNLGIIVEGIDDLETYPILIRRTRRDIDRIFPVKCDGLRKLKTKFVGFLREFELRRDRGVAKVLVIRDSDCGDAHDLEDQLRQRLELSRFKASFPIHFYAVKCKLESWLLADEEAINGVAQARGKAGRVERVSGALETIRQADQMLASVLWKIRLPATEEVYAHIARLADLQRVAERCPYFSEFQNRINAC